VCHTLLIADFYWRQSPDRTGLIPCHQGLRFAASSSEFFFNNLKAITGATTSSSSKSESMFVLFLPVSFAGELCHSFWYQTTGASFWRQKPVQNWRVCHHYIGMSFVG